jgi:cellulose synthase/poly-beta-1,6-N-acetylglucosamine synthase-like glycosyltransferase
MLVDLLNLFVSIFALALLWPVILLLFEVFCACFLVRKNPALSEHGQSICVLIPAHDEALGVATTIASVRANLKAADRILVIADNCTDETAAVAKAAGAQVIERADVMLRGKGHALAFGVDYLRKSPPDVVIIIDADCLVTSGSLAELAACASSKQRPMQAKNIMQWPQGYATSVAQRIAAFAWVFKNYIRPLGLSNAGLPCQLMGTGMALPWHLISQLQLGTSEIVEDIKFGLDCSTAGAAPAFYPETQIVSYFPTERTAEKTQRTRWEHGHIFLALKYLPLVVLKSLRTKNPSLFLMASDLAVLPLALLALAVVACLALTLAIAYFSSATFALGLAILNITGFVLAVFLGWYFHGRSALRGRDLLLVPVYILTKLPMYFKLIFRKQTQWVRTKRDER